MKNLEGRWGVWQVAKVPPESGQGPAEGDRRPAALRVLVLAPSVVLQEDGTEEKQLDAEREWQELAQAAADQPVRLELLRPASLSHLERALAAACAPWRREPYAAIYVSCHGLPGLVLLDDGHGLGVEVTGEELGQALRGQGVGLVVLGACGSAEGAGGEGEPEEGGAPDDAEARVGSVAGALLDAGVKAVVGAVGSPYDVMSANLAAQLLGMLARGTSVKEAFESALRALPGSERPTWRLYGDGSVVLERVEVEPGCFTIPPDPQGLPRCSRFLDRASELVKVSWLLDQGKEPVVWLGGEGGLGKTALAAEAAWRNAWRFGGGVAWVAFDRSPPSLEAVLEAAREMGLKVEGETLAERAEALARVASTPQRPVLFVLDNLDTVLEPADQGDASAGGVLRWLGSLRRPARALVTSRMEPGLGAVQASPGVAPLPLEASEELFWAAAGGPRPDLDPRDGECRRLVRDICGRLGGLPLALELVGARARQMDPRTLLANLETELASARLRGRPERQRSLEAALAGSFSVEGRPQAEDVLAVLAVFPAGAGPAMLEAILGEGNWSQGIHALCSLSVAREAGTGKQAHWHLLPPVRQFALGRVEQAAAARARRKGMEHLASVEVPDRGDAVNAAAAVAWLGELGGPWDRFEFAEGAGLRLYKRGYWTEAAVLLEAAHGVAKTLGEHDAAVSAHNLGMLAQGRGQPQEAERLYRASLKILEELGDRSGVAKSLHQLGTLAQDRGQPQQAEGLYRESLKIKKELGDRSGVAASLHNLGILAQARGQPQEAERLCRESLKIKKELGDRSGVAKSLHQLGMLARVRGQPQEAERLYRESLKIKKELGDRSGAASSLHQLGILALDRGQAREAERLCRESLKIAEELGDRSGVAKSLHQLGILAQGRGQPREAERLYRESLKIAEELGDRSGVAASLHQLGNLAREVGQPRQAEGLYRESLKIKEELGDRAGVALSLGALGTLSLQSGDVRSAEEHFQHSLESSLSAESVRPALGAYWGLIRASLLQGDRPKARGYLDRATAYARRQGPDVERLWQDMTRELLKEL